MVENGLVFAVDKAIIKEAKKKSRKEGSNKHEKAKNTIQKLQEKYNFSFGLMDKTDAEKMTDKERKQYYEAIKYTTSYNDKFLNYLGLC